jgi:hypothetical protein
MPVKARPWIRTTGTRVLVLQLLARRRHHGVGEAPAPGVAGLSGSRTDVSDIPLVRSVDSL